MDITKKFDFEIKIIAWSNDKANVIKRPNSGNTAVTIASDAVHTGVGNRADFEDQKVLNNIDTRVDNRTNTTKELYFGDNDVNRYGNRANLCKRLDFINSIIAQTSNGTKGLDFQTNNNFRTFFFYNLANVLVNSFNNLSHILMTFLVAFVILFALHLLMALVYIIFVISLPFIGDYLFDCLQDLLMLQRIMLISISS